MKNRKLFNDFIFYSMFYLANPLYRQQIILQVHEQFRFLPISYLQMSFNSLSFTIILIYFLTDENNIIVSLYNMDESLTHSNIMIDLQQEENQLEEYERLKNCPEHRVLISENKEKQNGKKIFTYHYSENSQFQLGAGSYGRILVCFYEDEQKKKVHKLAMKIIKIPNKMDQIRKIQEIVAFTRQEIKSLIKLRKNENIIKIEDVIGDPQNNRIYLILEYCNDKDLDSYFNRLYDQKMIRREEDILYFFKQILNAFKDLYNLNIIHRDIKPQNILVHDGILKIGDFGLSQQLFQKTEEFYEGHYGTTLTASPQIRFKQKYTNKCDIYSLGVTLYWMVYRIFPFKNSQTQDQFMKNSVKFQQEPQVKISNELVSLIESMLTYSEDDRIEWTQLFNHPILSKIDVSSYPNKSARDTIGRDLQGQYQNSKILDDQIPKQLYMYIMGNNDNFDINSIQSRNYKQNPFLSKFMPIFFQVHNQKYRLNFLKQFLREVYQFKPSDKTKNKIQFALIKDLIRLGLQNYIIYVMTNIKKQLTGVDLCKILDPKLINECKGSKQFTHLVDSFQKDVQMYNKSNKKPKLSGQQKDNLIKRCHEYHIGDQFQCILSSKILKQQFILQNMQTCFVEMIYFIKDEVKFYYQKAQNLASIEEKRFRQLILLIHHFFMFIQQKTIFPKKYDQDINYDFQRFNQRQRYLNANAFRELVRSIVEIIDRFQN